LAIECISFPEGFADSTAQPVPLNVSDGRKTALNTAELLRLVESVERAYQRDLSRERRRSTARKVEIYWPRTRCWGLSIMGRRAWDRACWKKALLTASNDWVRCRASCRITD